MSPVSLNPHRKYTKKEKKKILKKLGKAQNKWGNLEKYEEKLK